MPHGQASLTAISQTSLDGVMIVDMSGRVRGWNRNIEAIFGWSDKEVIGSCISDLVVAPHQRDEFFKRFAALAEGRNAGLLNRRYERDALRKDGSLVPVEIGIMETQPGADKMYVVFVRDLTEQRRASAQIAARTKEVEQAQERLRESEQFHRNVVELSSMFAWTANAQGQTVSLGPKWEEWTGVPCLEALGLAWVKSIHPADAQWLLKRWNKSVETGADYDSEFRIRVADGSYRWSHARARRLTDPRTGELIWYGMLEDIHEKRIASEAFQRAQAELVHVSRLSAMGAMGSAIAHDLNQPLTAIAHYVRGCLKLLESVEGPVKPEIGAALEDADRSALRAGDIVRRVREFVARGHVELQSENIVALVKEACKLGLIDAAFRHIIWRTEFGAPCDVIADRVQIQQVLVNLIRNAVEAMTDESKREIVIRTEHAPPGFCEVSVSDTGRGLSAEAAGRMFDPFYTTRKDGTGIGLSISRMIVQAHGGTIWHEHGPEGGTTMKFTLPMEGCHP